MTTELKIKWRDKSNNETGFELERCQGESCANFAKIADLPANTTTYTDVGLQFSTTYRYRIRAINRKGKSIYSNILTLVTIDDVPNTPAPPVAPTGVSVTPADKQNTIDFTVLSNLTYTIKRSLADGGPYTILVAGITSSGYVDTGLTNGTIYYYVVVATDQGVNSVNSSQASGTPFATVVPPPAPPSAPTNVIATAGDARVQLQWTAPSNVSSYIIKRATVSGGPYSQIGTSLVPNYLDTTVTNTVTYYYVVIAVNAGGNSTSSVPQAVATPLAATPPPPPPPPPIVLAAPTGLSIVALDGALSLNWNSVINATKYLLKRALTSGGPYTSAVITVNNSTSYTNTGLSNGTEYYYVVSAADNSNNESPNSSEVHAHPIFVNTPPPIGNLISVPAGANLQAVMNAANYGDILELEANATFAGNYVTPTKSGAGTIKLRSQNAVTAAGTRIGAISGLARLLAPGIDPVLYSQGPAAGWTFENIEFASSYAARVNTVYNLINLGTYDGNQEINVLSDLPRNFMFDRCYIHGNPTGNLIRAIAANVAGFTVKESYISEIHDIGSDSQCICSWNGIGPFTINNNYLSAAGENILFGGADPSITNLVPSDITMKKNYVFKPLTWKPSDISYAGIPWSVKNLFELKNAQRVLCEGNIFENCWLSSQVGWAIVLTPRNQSGTAPWCKVKDVNFRHNTIKHVGGGLDLLGTDDGDGRPPGTVSQPLENVNIDNNIWIDINFRLGENGWFAVILLGSINLNIRHNTIVDHPGGALIVFDSGGLSTGFQFKDNFCKHGDYGVFASGGDIGIPALNRFAPGYTFLNNVLAGGVEAGYSTSYPPTTLFPTVAAFNSSFINSGAGNYRLVSSSPFKNAASDGTDIGVNQDTLEAAQT